MQVDVGNAFGIYLGLAIASR